MLRQLHADGHTIGELGSDNVEADVIEDDQLMVFGRGLPQALTDIPARALAPSAALKLKDPIHHVGNQVGNRAVAALSHQPPALGVKSDRRAGSAPRH